MQEWCGIGVQFVRNWRANYAIWWTVRPQSRVLQLNLCTYLKYPSCCARIQLLSRNEAMKPSLKVTTISLSAAVILSNFLSCPLVETVGMFMAGENYDSFIGLNRTSTMDGIDLQVCSNSSATIPHDLFVPIFVLTRDRVTSLNTTLESYRRTIKSPYEIVVLDHSSTFPPMVEYLEELKSQNISVMPLKGNSWKLALEESNSVIQTYLAEHPAVQFYVFTDPDVAFLRTAPDVLLFYAGLLSCCPFYKVVGPGLQISDIPSHYKKILPSGKSVFQQHSRFWTKVPNIANWNGVGFHVVDHPIDTTFAMYGRDVPFRRLTRPSLRAYAPYAAVHVDWYDSTDNLPADKVYYAKQQSGVNNW